MKKLVFALVLSAACASFAQGLRSRVDAYLAQNGIDPDVARQKAWVTYGTDAQIESWRAPGVPQPAEFDLPSDEDAPGILEAFAASAELARQAAKPAEQKAFENRYYDLVRQVLTVAGDPRASEVPTPKLGFVLLGDLIRDHQAVDPMGAVSLTLELLTVDAALKRYSALWWDDAVEHELED